MHRGIPFLIYVVFSLLPTKVACQWADTLAIPFIEGGRWGLYNLGGQRILPPTFRDMGPCQNGLAPARLEGRWGYINARGQWVIPPVYDYTEAFNNRIGWVWRDSIPTAIQPTGMPLAVQPDYSATVNRRPVIEPNKPPKGYNLFVDGRSGYLTLYDSTRHIWVSADSGYVLGVHPHRLAPGVWVTYGVFGHPVFLDSQFRFICRLPALTERELWGHTTPHKLNTDVLQFDCVRLGNFFSRRAVGFESINPLCSIPSGFDIVVSPTADTVFQEHYLARKLWLTNTSSDTLMFDGDLFCLGFALQAIGPDGAWHNISSYGIGHCDNFYGCEVPLYPNEVREFTMPEFEGEYETVLRLVHFPYKRDIYRQYEPYQGTPAPAAVSPVWRGSVNPGQFWRKNDAPWGRQRFPYWN